MNSKYQQIRDNRWIMRERHLRSVSLDEVLLGLRVRYDGFGASDADAAS